MMQFLFLFFILTKKYCLETLFSLYEGQVGHNFFFRSSDIRQSGIGVEKNQFLESISYALRD